MKKLLLILIILTLSLTVASSVKGEGVLLFLSPSSESFAVEDTFSVELKVDTAGIPINAAEATIYFPVDKVGVLNISKDDSIFTLWPEEPAFSNLIGEISFAGGLPHPGCKEIENIITIEFKAKKEGTMHLTFDRAQVLADDGKGTNILVYLKAAKYSIFKEMGFPEAKPEISLPQLFSLTHPREDEWYNNDSPRFQWNLTPETTGVSFALDQNPETIPDIISEGKIQFKD